MSLLFIQDNAAIIDLGSETPSIASGRESPSLNSSVQAKTEDDFVAKMRSKIMEELQGQVM